MSVSNQTHRPIAQLKAVKNPLIENLTSPATIDNEFSYALPENTKKIMIKTQNQNSSAEIKFNFISIDTEGKWITIPPRNAFFDYSLDLVSTTVYFKVNKASEVIEVLTWT